MKQLVKVGDKYAIRKKGWFCGWKYFVPNVNNEWRRGMPVAESLMEKDRATELFYSMTHNFIGNNRVEVVQESR